MNTRGYSLIELLIVVGIFAMMLSALVFLYLRFGTVFSRQSATINVSYSASAVLNAFDVLTKQSDTILSSQSIAGTTYTSGSTTLVMRLPSISSSGDIVGGTYDYAVLYVSGASCYELVAPNTVSARHAVSKRLSDVVSNLTFAYDTGDVTQSTRVTVDLTTRTSVRGVPISTRLTGSAHLRNK